jgi:tocopherol O-methyltransferase
VIIPNLPQTAADVGRHYDALDAAYRIVWGEHVHHGYWLSGSETADEAAEALVRLVEQALELIPGQRVCDIGCGYGATGATLAKRNQAEVVGFTVSAVQAEIAQARNKASPGFTALCHDWLDNALPDQGFDRAYAIESSEHMVDKPLFFSETYRVLKPGGRFVVCAWLEGPHVRPWEIRHLLEPICREGRLPSMGSRADYDALAAGAGFQLQGYDDISRNVRRTWTICARRLAMRLVTDPRIRRIALSRETRDRVFLLTVPRLIAAMRTGAMRYGLFVWRKPA